MRLLKLILFLLLGIFCLSGVAHGYSLAGLFPNRQQANTKDEDPTGLLNEGFRYRDLKTGTFITRDPLGMVDGPNVYTYVNQNPWTFFDPRGLDDVRVEGKSVLYVRENFLGIDKETHQVGTLKSEPTIFGPLSGAEVKLSDAFQAKIGVDQMPYGEISNLGGSDSVNELVEGLQNVATAGLAHNDDIGLSDLKEASQWMGDAASALKSKVEGGDYANLAELMEGFESVGWRGLTDGGMTDSASSVLSKNQQTIVESLEKSDFVNSLPGMQEHPPGLRLGDTPKQHARDQGLAEAKRMSSMQDVIDNAVRIREEENESSE